MYQIDVASAATTLPASSAAGTPGFFTDGNPATGVPATIVPAEFMNSVMLEILNVMAAASIAPEKGDHAQLLAAINAIVQNSAAPAATTDKAGVVELATAQEGITGTDTVRAIVPAVLAAVLASYAKSADVQTSIQTAIAALVDSSPTALNTLNELATALGDDPNFATTVMNAIAGKQAASANLAALAALVGAANQLPYFTAEGVMALAAFPAFARTLLAAADQAAARAALGAGAPATASLGATSGWWRDADTGMIRQYIIVDRGDIPSNHTASNEFSVTWPITFLTAALYAKVSVRSNVKGAVVATVAGQYDLGLSSGNFYVEEWAGGVENVSIVIEVVGY